MNVHVSMYVNNANKGSEYATSVLVRTHANNPTHACAAEHRGVAAG